MPNDSQNTSDSVSITLTKESGDTLSAFVDGFKVTGRVHVAVHGEDGSLKDERHIHNLVVTTGKGHIASLMSGAGPTAMTFMAVGSGTNAAVVGDTDLQTEITTGLGGTRVTITRSNPTAPVARYVATWTAGQATNGAITEAGIFNAGPVGPASGTMLCRSVFTAIPKAAGDSLTITWDITVS